ncbi:hypothetical protein T06_6566 [Trichinella sp. T6]|nr:hypothetical protein T06_6566 [Trichinella sp. T6]
MSTVLRTNPPVDAGASSNSDDHVSNPVSCCDERARPPQRLVSFLPRRLVKYSCYALACVRHVLREPTAMGPLDGNNHTTVILSRSSRFCTPAVLKYKFARRSFVRQLKVDCIMWILLGQPNVGSQEDGRVGRMQADQIRHEYAFVLFGNGQSEERTPSTAANRESICNRNKQWHENSMITQTTAISTEFRVHRARGWRPQRVARTANEQLAHCGGACYLWRRSKSPSASY